MILLFAVLVGILIWRNTKPDSMHKVSFMEGLNLTGLPVVTLFNNNRAFNFVLDTGSYHSIINEEVLKHCEHEKSDIMADLAGIDGVIHKDQKIVHMTLQYKDKNLPAKFIVSDLSGVFNQIKKETGVHLHGLLGSDFFRENKYIIDYKEMVAYSKKI